MSCFRLFLRVFGLLPVLLLPAGFAAAKPDAARVPDVRPVYQPDGHFGYCLADIPYDDGRALSVALSPKDEINVGLMIPGGGFVARRQYDLTVVLTKAKARDAASAYDRTVRAIGMDVNTLLLQMSTNASFAKALADSDLLIAKSAGTSLDFPLPGMRSLLDKLKTCNRNKPKMAPSAAGKHNTVPGDVMPEAVRALLAEAGLKDITPLNFANVPDEQRPADIVWKTGSLIGGLRERLVPEDKDLTTLVGLHVDGLKKKCDGAFKTEIGREETAFGLSLRSAEVECQMKAAKGKDAVIVSAILFYLTPAHRFTFFTHEGVASDKKAAMEARDALRRIILRMAGERAGDR